MNRHEPPKRVPVIGGPGHGMVVEYKFRTVEVAMRSGVRDYLRRDSPELLDLKVLTLQYSLHEFEMYQGSLRLTGWAYVWNQLKPDEAVHSALGYLVAEAMKGGDA